MHRERRRSHSRLHGSDLTGAEERETTTSTTPARLTPREDTGGTQTGALISSTERAGAARGLSQCRAWAGACPVGSHLQEFPGFKAPPARCSGLPLPRRCTRSLGSGAGPGLTSQEGGFAPFLEKKKWPPPRMTLLVLCVLNPDLWGGWF